LTADSLLTPHHPHASAVCHSLHLAVGRPETLHPSLRVPHRSTRMGQPSSPQSKALSLPRSKSKLAEGKTASGTCSCGGSRHLHHADPSLPPALSHLLLPEPQDLGRKVEGEVPERDRK